MSTPAVLIEAIYQAYLARKKRKQQPTVETATLGRPVETAKRKRMLIAKIPAGRENAKVDS